MIRTIGRNVLVVHVARFNGGHILGLVNRLKVRREALNRSFPGEFTQAAVAQRLGIGLRSYQHYEMGDREPPASVAIAIARDLDVSVEQLGFGDGGRS